MPYTTIVMSSVANKGSWNHVILKRDHVTDRLARVPLEKHVLAVTYDVFASTFPLPEKTGCLAEMLPFSRSL